ncbi:unnamed protein product [Ostreobium quekettii]|uniref:Calmodulin n=1 Tax=Ostreobium quekettii TaxID=121088 RepID=A0A8S1JAG7_9CHLO|nr:unnamed protein product [Ostreobium quekettii]|eukprot:evm.model.scf_705.6 EVM.evm.TU.scf_705.6   scf_705:43488-45929(-)
MGDDEFESVVHGIMQAARVKKLKTREDKMRYVFERLDRDQSGTLTTHEIVHLARKLDPTADEAKIKESMRFLDKDGSDSVNEDEFVDTMVHFLRVIESQEDFDRTVAMLLQSTPPQSAKRFDEKIPRKYAALVSALPTTDVAKQILAEDVIAAMVDPSSNIALVDARRPEERAVSTIPNSVPVHLERDSSAPYGYRVAIQDAHGFDFLYETSPSSEDGGKSGLHTIIVAFCNTGERGGAAALSLSEHLCRKVHNLYGGLIHYFNIGGRLVDSEGQDIEALHPGSRKMAGYIVRKNCFPLLSLPADDRPPLLGQRLDQR